MAYKSGINQYTKLPFGADPLASSEPIICCLYFSRFLSPTRCFQSTRSRVLDRRYHLESRAVCPPSRGRFRWLSHLTRSRPINRHIKAELFSVSNSSSRGTEGEMPNMPTNVHESASRRQPQIARSEKRPGRGKPLAVPTKSWISFNRSNLESPVRSEVSHMKIKFVAFSAGLLPGFSVSRFQLALPAVPHLRREGSVQLLISHRV